MAVSGFHSWLQFWFQLSASADPEDSGEWAPWLGPCHPQFLAHWPAQGPALAVARLCKVNQRKISLLFLSLYLFTIQIIKWTNKMLKLHFEIRNLAYQLHWPYPPGEWSGAQFLTPAPDASFLPVQILKGSHHRQSNWIPAHHAADMHCILGKDLTSIFTVNQQMGEHMCSAVCVW